GEGAARQGTVGGTRRQQICHALTEALQPGLRQGRKTPIGQWYESSALLPGLEYRAGPNPTGRCAARRRRASTLKPQVKGMGIEVQAWHQRRRDHERLMV